VRTGKFDPWQTMYDEAETAVVAQRRAASEPSTPPLRLTDKSTPEEIAEYQRRALERQQELVEAVEGQVAETVSAFDKWCVETMFDLYDEAFWMGETHQFRDGRPLSEQSEWRVILLGMIRAKIQERQWGGDGKDKDPGDAPEFREMTPEEMDAWLGKHQ
jgi:hypothetical protein